MRSTKYALSIPGGEDPLPGRSLRSREPLRLEVTKAVRMSWPILSSSMGEKVSESIERCACVSLDQEKKAVADIAALVREGVTKDACNTGSSRFASLVSVVVTLKSPRALEIKPWWEEMIEP